MNSPSAIKMLPRNFFLCKQIIAVPHCWMLRSMILRKCVGAYSTRFVVPQFLQERTKLNTACTNGQVIRQSCNLHQFKACNCLNTCHQRRNFCVLKPSRPVISSGYFSENRDEIIERLQILYEKNSTRKSWTLTGKVKINDSSKSAVMLPFCLVRGEPSILLTLRSTKLNSHRGQVSFPGGRMDKEDPNEIHTALREMEEELGIPSSCADVLGELPPILDRTQRLVHPVVGFIGDIESLNMQRNPDEVSTHAWEGEKSFISCITWLPNQSVKDEKIDADIIMHDLEDLENSMENLCRKYKFAMVNHKVEAAFTMTLAHICDSRNRRSTLFMTPKYSYTSPVFLRGDHRLWGLSAILLNAALGVILPDDYIPLKDAGVAYIRPK